MFDRRLLEPDRRPAIIVCISNGGRNVPAYAGTLFSSQLNQLQAFLQSRKRDGTTPLDVSHEAR